MASLTIIYWRDIPSQVIVKAGRSSAKRELSERFIRAIDAAAMHAGRKATTPTSPSGGAAIQCLAAMISSKRLRRRPSGSSGNTTPIVWRCSPSTTGAKGQLDPAADALRL
jgi:hypothetical protein